jgi:hypothetical protein
VRIAAGVTTDRNKALVVLLSVDDLEAEDLDDVFDRVVRVIQDQVLVGNEFLIAGDNGL